MKNKVKTAVIVESPTKAKTISKFLPSSYKVEASFGHVRDLPKGTLGVDVDNNFTPSYVIPRNKIKQVNKFKKGLQKYLLFYLATDPDREGEAIAYHIREILKKENPQLTDQNFKRVVFHEITKEAIEDSFERPMILNEPLIEAQTARRVLDRLVGYQLSPLLWKKIRRGLSAGRVQSVAVRLIVDRERDIQAFKPQEYWEVEADFLTLKKEQFRAKLFKRGDINKKNGKIKLKDEVETQKVLQDLEKGHYQIAEIEKREVQKSPYPPFITSTLQRAAVNFFGFTVKRTMQAAQRLFENGYITYMRTDSFTLSQSAVESIRRYIEKEFGEKYLPSIANRYKTRSKVAQEAHEAIRPTDILKIPQMLNEQLEGDEKKLYELIWKRTLACQMTKAIYDQETCNIVTNNLKPNYLFKAYGNKLRFLGWKKAYDNNDDDENSNKDVFLPELTAGEDVSLEKLYPEQKFTQPPARYTEASLIKALEEKEIGRPSTYAPTISTIMTRMYIEKEGKALKPTEVGIAVTDFLIKYFPEIINYDFTAEVEEDLDAIARNEKEWVPIIAKFYRPFAQKIDQVIEEAEKVELEEDKTDAVCEICGKPMVVKVGRFGKFIACSGYPECKNTKPFVQNIGIKCLKCGGDVVLKRTRKGRKFYGCSNYPKCDYASWKKPEDNKDNLLKADK